MKLQCAECKSKRHHTAFYPGRALWKEEADPAAEHGREEETPPQSQVTTKCTKVCSGDLTDRSCSNISLVKVYPAGHRDKAVKLFALVDEQSNWSVVRSQFLEVFNDQSPSAPYTLKTCPGVRKSTGRRVMVVMKWNLWMELSGSHYQAS